MPSPSTPSSPSPPAAPLILDAALEPGEHLVEAQGLSVGYSGGAVCSPATFRLDPGEALFLVGVNGAGKSTLLRTCCGLLRPLDGLVRVLGLDPSPASAGLRSAVARDTGEETFFPALSVREHLTMVALGHGLVDADDVVDSVLEKMGIMRVANAVPDRLSSGQRRRVVLASVLVRPRSLLVLDEPTSGLDPLMERVFTEEVARAAGEGRTVLLSSHILAEVQRLCSAVTIIKNGHVVEHGDLGTLRRLSRTRIELGVPTDELAIVSQELETMDLDVVEDSGRLSLEVPAERVPAVLSLAGEHRIQDVTCEPASLEDLFLRHYEEA